MKLRVEGNSSKDNGSNDHDRIKNGNKNNSRNDKAAFLVVEEQSSGGRFRVWMQGFGSA